MLADGFKFEGFLCKLQAINSGLLSQNLFEVSFRRAGRSDVEVFYQVVEDILGDEGRQCRAEVNILDAQGEEGQEDADSFLFVPREDEGQGQIVDAAVEGFCQSDSYLDSAVCVVALAHIHDARQAADSAEVEVVEAVFAASQGEDDRISRGLFNEFRVVVTARTSAVATADEEEVFDSAGFDSVDDFVSNGEDRAMTKASRNGAAAVDAGEMLVFCIAAEFQGFFDDRREVFVFADLSYAVKGTVVGTGVP